MRQKANCWYIQVREMIGTENILFFRIEFRPVFALIRYEDEGEHQPGPPTIYNPDQMELFPKENRHKQER